MLNRDERRIVEISSKKLHHRDLFSSRDAFECKHGRQRVVERVFVYA